MWKQKFCYKQKNYYFHNFSNKTKLKSYETMKIWAGFNSLIIIALLEIGRHPNNIQKTNINIWKKKKEFCYKRKILTLIISPLGRIWNRTERWKFESLSNCLIIASAVNKSAATTITSNNSKNTESRLTYCFIIKIEPRNTTRKAGRLKNKIDFFMVNSQKTNIKKYQQLSKKTLGRDHMLEKKSALISFPFSAWYFFFKFSRSQQLFFYCFTNTEQDLAE